MLVDTLELSTVAAAYIGDLSAIEVIAVTETLPRSSDVDGCNCNVGVGMSLVCDSPVGGDININSGVGTVAAASTTMRTMAASQIIIFFLYIFTVLAWGRA